MYSIDIISFPQQFTSEWSKEIEYDLNKATRNDYFIEGELGCYLESSPSLFFFNFS